MMKIKIQQIIEKFKNIGIDIGKIDDAHIPLEEYDKDGEFDYELYKKTQDGLNGHKVHQQGPSFVQPSERDILNYIKNNIQPIKFGICHGTRRGTEQASLGRSLGVEVIGTEIADSAELFPNTIQMDFHDLKDEWINSVSFIYTNSLDHSYDPHLAIGNWMKCLHKTGCIFIHYATLDLHGDKYDGRQLSQDWLNKDIWHQKKYDKKLSYNLADCFHFKPSVIEKIMLDHNETDYKFFMLNEDYIVIKRIN